MKSLPTCFLPVVLLWMVSLTQVTFVSSFLTSPLFSICPVTTTTATTARTTTTTPSTTTSAVVAAAATVTPLSTQWLARRHAVASLSTCTFTLPRLFSQPPTTQTPFPSFQEPAVRLPSSNATDPPSQPTPTPLPQPSDSNPNPTDQIQFEPINPEEYNKRRRDWAERYTSFQGLKQTFGHNKYKIWGDLNAPTSRRLYKTLLPKVLLELVGRGVEPEDLAPLAYQARQAAKMYARYRSHLPSRLMASLFDGFRMLRKYGRFQIRGMSYEQLWEKYQSEVYEDLKEADPNEPWTDQERTVRNICWKILESSCRTNKKVDRWILWNRRVVKRQELLQIAETLEDDVRDLLLHSHPETTADGTPFVETTQQEQVEQQLRCERLNKLLARWKQDSMMITNTTRVE
eukprot:Nitzschia sp. Nitz4//scaffold263_size26989//23870//25075//NITZ4_008228-RA/size26989-processed-gene-0.26-mRNA-1//-1//CDS//3329544778//8398//frame0